MKSIISKIAVTGIAAICLTLNIQATPVNRGVNDTSKMSKMKKADKMEGKKMDKMAPKMSHNKMAKDSGKMSKM